ncbi:hypothetical protein FOQG_18320 [Fusarium oxysporum f. sp. raphani 54005]|uniref:FAD-binding PCMH-type domain-containing protein n=1 Tax=Fusarium oxysporum f. sp. raphani 54005 TaxID=1089458 RepID=X0B488_FUSOX|nr:hypothetical protein FOQG_18320 [Fusarium oxysporum f. sp. raphani 54005]
MDHGIEIYLNQLNDVKIFPDGKTVEIGGGTVSKKVTDTLWAAEKQTATWDLLSEVTMVGSSLQGHHGIIADQILTMNVVLINGSFKMIDQKFDLFWTMKGAGHNFGIVISVTAKIYDIEHRDWAIEALVFSGEQVGEVYRAANEHLLRKQPPIILFWIIQERVGTVDPAATKLFHDIGPLSIEAVAGDYNDMAGWTGISLSSPPCQKDGHVNPRFPLHLQSYNVPAMEKAYKLFGPVA